MLWSTVSKEDDVGLQQVNSPKTISGRRIGAEKDHLQSTKSLRKMDAQLGRPLCGEEGFLQRGTHLDRNRWEHLAKPI